MLARQEKTDLNRGMSRLVLPTSLHACFILVLVSCWLPGRASPGAELILGRISLKVNPAEPRPVGPLRLRSDLQTVFRELLREKQIPASKVTPDRVAAVLATHHLILSRKDSPDEPSPAQWEQLSGTAGNVVWLADSTSAESVAGEYTLSLRAGPPPAAPLQVQDLEAKHLLVTYGDQPVLRYNYGVVQERPDRTGPYDRACYIHPVWSPSGKIVSGDFSPEHIHQRGVFLAWRTARLNDMETDFWGLGASTGRTLPSGRPPQIVTGPVFARLTISNEGRVDDTVAFDEQVDVTVYAVDQRGWLFDVAVRQVPRTKIELPQIYYGGMSFRGPSGWLSKSSGSVKQSIARGVSFEGVQWLPAGTKLDVLTSEGKDRTSGDRTTARWIDFTGPLGDSWGGLALHDHVSSPRYPTPLRIHPELPYFSVAFVQREPFTIHPDRPLSLVYRIRAHDGRPDHQTNERVAATFNRGPQVSWEAP